MGKSSYPFTYSKSNQCVHNHKLIDTLSTISITLLLSMHRQIWVAEHRTARVKPFLLPSERVKYLSLCSLFSVMGLLFSLILHLLCCLSFAGLLLQENTSVCFNRYCFCQLLQRSPDWNRRSQTSTDNKTRIQSVWSAVGYVWDPKELRSLRGWVVKGRVIVSVVTIHVRMWQPKYCQIRLLCDTHNRNLSFPPYTL